MKLIKMSAWDEVLGPVLNVQMDEGYVLAQIGKISVMLPPELEQKLRSLKGIRIGLLRTDLPQKEYLVRIIPEKELNHNLGAISAEEAVRYGGQRIANRRRRYA